jgi:diaminohydroxyphosphoribosylaminopyrimidine deaminase/5-amino-6-(5-phosphoribosylamino)uracil reductase
MVLSKPQHQIDSSWMVRALNLATRSRETSPNPMVGALFVKDNITLLGEGWHRKAGTPHAERNAFSEISSSELIRGSTLYVTLEPCNHFGRTPPCSELIIKSGVGRVVVCCLDPNPVVAGKSIELLRAAGIPVEVGIKEQLGRWINRRFMTFHERKRPYIILKWAQSLDGFMAPPGEGGYWISTEESRKMVHEWRSQEDAILVGTNTAIIDNPALTTRLVPGKNPLRVVLDKNGRVPLSHQIFDGSASTLVVGATRDSLPRELFVEIKEEKNPLRATLEELHRRSVLSIIIEGGAKVLNDCLDTGLWDEVRTFTSPHKLATKELGGGLKAPPEPTHSPSQEVVVGGDMLRTWYRQDASCILPVETDDIALLKSLEQFPHR